MMTSDKEHSSDYGHSLQITFERETALREILQVISCSRSDERPVFDLILQSATRLCEAETARLHMLNEAGTEHWMVASAGTELRVFEPGKRHSIDTPQVLARAMRERRTIAVDDLKDDEVYRSGDPIRTRIVDEEGVRTFLAVPLIENDHVIGGFALHRKEVRPFAQDQIALVEAFAAQAVIAIENVRQFRELQTRLEREAATREILEIISRSRDDVQPVLDSIVLNVARLCNARDVGLHLVNEAGTHSRLSAVLTPDPETFPLGETYDLSKPLQTTTAIREARIIHIPDLADDPLYRGGDPVRVKLVEQHGIRSRLSVPLLKGGSAFGCINLNRSELRPFNDAEIALIETFAAQAVIAIENARQFQELQARTHEVEQALEHKAATSEVLSVISRSTNDLQPVFDAIVATAARLCRATHAVMFMLRDGAYHLAASNNAEADFIRYAAEHPHALGRGTLTGRAALERRTLHLDDCLADPEYTAVELQKAGNYRTALCVPLLRQGEAIGVIALLRSEVDPFTERQIELVETFADQALIAIENVNLFRALETRTEEVQALNDSLEERVATQVGEIERMGRLKRFLSPAVADAVVSSGNDKLLSSHRALIAVLFCDIRGFTAFCETAEPEETIEVLQTYHEEMGTLIAAHGAGVDHRLGDGIMVIFNDPLPCDDPALKAVKMALAMRTRMAALCTDWRELGHRLGFGVGISLGYATVGMVGSAGRYEYTASGTAVNLAARLCEHAEDGEILLSPRAFRAVKDRVRAEPAGELSLKGIQAPVDVFRVVRLEGPTAVT